jgi:hypothetical protein
MPTLDEISQKPTVYSWSAKVDFVLNSGGEFKDVNSDTVRVPWREDLVLTLEKQRIHPNLEGAGATGYRFILDATQTACEAEELGKRLACALLKVAIDRRWGLRLSWPDTPLPCRVVDRTASRGPTIQSFGSATGHLGLSDFASALQDGFNKLAKAPYRLLLSMELCASAEFELDSRAKLIVLVSAVEAIVEQELYGSDVHDLVTSLTSLVSNSSIEDESIKSSILCQVKNLKRESIRRAIKRKLSDAGFTAEELALIEGAYSARSKIVHEGLRVPELTAMTAELDTLIRRLYSHEIESLHLQ